jgi:hypothetical protein
MIFISLLHHYTSKLEKKKYLYKSSMTNTLCEDNFAYWVQVSSILRLTGWNNSLVNG